MITHLLRHYQLRMSYEFSELLNKGGAAINAALRLLLILCMFLLLGVASFFNLLDEQLRTTEVEHQWLRNQ